MTERARATDQQITQLRRELRDAEECAVAVAEVMRTVSRASFDLDEVLRTVIERSVELSGADFGNILRLDESTGAYRQVTHHGGVAPEFWELVKNTEFRPERGTLVGRTLLERRPVQIVDVLTDPEYRLGEAQRAGGYRTILGIPMLRDDLPVGVVVVNRGRVKSFSDREIRLVQTFADQAVVAIELAKLGTDLRQAFERERAISQVLQAMSSASFDLDPVLQTVIERAVELSGAEFGNILRLDEATGFYQVVAHHGEVDPAYWELVTHTPYKPDRGTLIGRTLAELRPVHIVDILEDPEYRFWEAQRTGGYRTILGVPMLRDGFPIGVFVVWRRVVQAFTEAEISLLTTFADQAALAIENVRLFQTVERQRAELARFAPQVASLLSSNDGKQLLAGHRREITALFADLRGFTAFAEKAEPEEVLGVLRDYHAAVGELVVRNGGTVEHFAGDGLMAFFNDPTLVTDHQRIAVRTAIEVRDRFVELADQWLKRGYELGLGIGVAVGYATLGRIGFEGRYDYGAVGNVVILASRLSDAAEPGEILISQRVNAAVDDGVDTQPVPDLQLKGFSRPVAVFRVVGAT